MINFGFKKRCQNFYQFFLLLSVLGSISEGYPAKVNKGSLSGDVIRHFACKGNNVGENGICMFAWDCILSNGSHVGTCVDRFYFGSCCKLPAGSNASFASSTTTVKPDAASTTISSANDNLKTTTADVTSNAVVTDITPNMLTDVDYKQACGRVFYKEKATGRVVNGQQADYAKWPWQISLRQWKRTTFMHKCGAALINENWAITAAHCVDGLRPEDILLRIGEFDMGSESESQSHLERRVQIVTTHPDFNPRSFENDLALMRFYEPLNFRENIIPICLPTTDDTFVNTTGYVTGWGRLFVDGPLPNILQEVQVPVITNSQCEQEYRKAGFLEIIPNIFLCAGYAEGQKDSCEGDSGGPLAIKQSNGRWVLAGIISWGIGCAEPHQPGVYTRISHFRHWISKILVF